MVRRGWSAIPAPSGWCEIIRGPRPPSVQWPKKGKGKGNQDDVGVQHRGASIPGSGARVPGGASRTQSSQPARVRTSPEATIAVARQQVVQLEGALAAFGDATGPEVTMLQNSLKVAKKAALEPSLEVQLSLCESFVSRAQKRLVAHDEARQRRLARLRVAVTEKVPPPPANAEIAALRARLASVEEERDDAMEGRPAKRVATGPQFRGKMTKDRPGRLRKDFMQMCDEEIIQWMQDRQADLHDTMLTGNATEVSRLCHVVADAATSFSKSLTPPSLLANTVA